MRIDAVIFGGGAAGLWLLDELVRRRRAAVLVEAGELGSGQTVAAQGIIHGGLKYSLHGLLTGSAASIREMPHLWRDCLQGRRAPDLGDVRIRSSFCYLWRTDSVASRLGMIGAKLGLRVAPQTLAARDRPAVLARCPGTVARLDEPVICPASLIASFAARYRERLLKIDAGSVAFERDAAGAVRAVQLAADSRRLTLRPGCVVLAAGAGNAFLRERAGLDAAAMQRRPLHMTLLRGPLPPLFGHCVDGAKTRVTITSDVDSAGRTVWQVGGQLAEDGTAWDSQTLIARARSELLVAVPGLDLAGVQWRTYRVDRAERATPTGARPETVQVLREANVITAWPTKLALAPVLAQQVADLVEAPEAAGGPDGRADDGPGAAEETLPGDSDWPRPEVARPLWETCCEWLADETVPAGMSSRRLPAATERFPSPEPRT